MPRGADRVARSKVRPLEVWTERTAVRVPRRPEIPAESGCPCGTTGTPSGEWSLLHCRPRARRRSVRGRAGSGRTRQQRSRREAGPRPRTNSPSDGDRFAARHRPARGADERFRRRGDTSAVPLVMNDCHDDREDDDQENEDDRTGHWSEGRRHHLTTRQTSSQCRLERIGRRPRAIGGTCLVRLHVRRAKRRRHASHSAPTAGERRRPHCSSGRHGDARLRAGRRVRSGGPRCERSRDCPQVVQ